MEMKQHADAKSFWLEYSTGINGSPSLASRESDGAAWRSWKGGKQRWSDRMALVKAAESAAGIKEGLADLKARLDRLPKKSTSPDWNGLIRELAEKSGKGRKRKRSPAADGPDGGEVQAPSSREL